MIQLFFILLIFILISLTLLFLNFLISKKSYQDREKISPFECGFDPLSTPHYPFSIHFFMISLIFLIFDIEITLLIPLVYLLFYFNIFTIMTSFLFLIILNLGLLIEYLEKSIDWKI